ncbi:DUF4236 domain-containing protein [Inconstantimicrobium mannanitabidum]|uniref:Uncharacterized protein n=1 Tax=Inconstantimicrobium mannanitabidum TaxID=1604901 RepID=A0ACB5R9W6_9CLOT|nr:DUF4236 domain-containing protein [Clostridium sp. TW13]GKX65824.1 hypothetical protein rsdtw13_10820 [Clostridium sp. TW13]
MGLSFRKSIKLTKNTRINLSKTGGIGISSGVKGARISANEQGIRATGTKDGLQYRKNVGYNDVVNSESNFAGYNQYRKTFEYYRNNYGVHANFILMFLFWIPFLVGILIGQPEISVLGLIVLPFLLYSSYKVIIFKKFVKAGLNQDVEGTEKYLKQLSKYKKYKKLLIKLGFIEIQD